MPEQIFHDYYTEVTQDTTNIYQIMQVPGGVMLRCETHENVPGTTLVVTMALIPGARIVEVSPGVWDMTTNPRTQAKVRQL